MNRNQHTLTLAAVMVVLAFAHGGWLVKEQRILAGCAGADGCISLSLTVPAAAPASTQDLCCLQT